MLSGFSWNSASVNRVGSDWGRLSNFNRYTALQYTCTHMYTYHTHVHTKKIKSTHKPLQAEKGSAAITLGASWEPQKCTFHMGSSTSQSHWTRDQEQGECLGVYKKDLVRECTKSASTAVLRVYYLGQSRQNSLLFLEYLSIVKTKMFHQHRQPQTSGTFPIKNYFGQKILK